VPVITNLLTPQQAGATSVITGSIQYLDVGIKLEVEPRHVDNDVGIKVNLGVSNIAKTVETASRHAYQIGTRSADLAAPARRRDAGAGRPDQRPGPQHREQGAGARPGADRRPLFSSTKGDATKTEIVLSITPRIVRPQTLPARSGDVWSGTESVVREKPLRLDPIGAAKAGNVAEMPALAFGPAAARRQGPNHRAEGRRCGGQQHPGRQPCGRGQRAGAGRRSQCRADCGSHRRRCDWHVGRCRHGRGAGASTAVARRHRQQQPAAGADTSAAARRHRSSRAAQWRRRRSSPGGTAPPAPPVAPAAGEEG
jgi:hypothetical protein